MHRLSATPLRLLLLPLMVAAGCEHPPPTDSPNAIAEPAAPATNRLISEKSPYLLHHADNPVDWYPWGDEAFARAREEQKPVFLSVGYSTCHWCHVMERESFRNQRIARFLNEHFVCIKVDREERPDIDRIYLAYVEATTGSAGWPMTVFLTPEAKPFFGGTYFPPEPSDGMPGFLSLATRIHELWTTRRTDITASMDTILAQIGSELVPDPGPDPSAPAEQILQQAASRIASRYDPKNGGFGGPPKFPTPSVPLFLLEHGMLQSDTKLVEMVRFTAERMAAGGIHDQLGGGFSRYAVDARWLVPHFEKMLYDNAQLLELYLELYQATGDPRHADVARAIVRYVLRDMTHPEGGFFSAEDADSEGHEGKFYLWTRQELETLLTPDESAVVRRHYGITSDGNFIDHSHPEPLRAGNVLSVVDPALDDAEQALIASARQKMLAKRATRVRPHVDDKVLTSWNGLMLGALARAAIILDDPKALHAARKNAAFLQQNMWDEATATLHHRWRGGSRDSVQLLDAYACLLKGLLDLYETTLDPRFLTFAVKIADAMINRFHDPRAGGFWQSADGPEKLILRVKDDTDAAQPSGNSVAALALLKLADMTGRSHYREVARQSLRLFSHRMERSPLQTANLMRALAYSLKETRRVVITGTPKDPARELLLHSVHSVYQPHKIVMGTEPPADTDAYTDAGSDATQVRICTGRTCLLPTADPARIRKLLTLSTGHVPAD